MEFEVLTNYADDFGKVVEVLPRRHNEEKCWKAEEVCTFRWLPNECYTFSHSGKAIPKTGADFKREIVSAFEAEIFPKEPSPTE